MARKLDTKMVKKYDGEFDPGTSNCACVAVPDPDYLLNMAQEKPFA